MAAKDGPEVSIVISTRDRVERLGALLEALSAQTLDPSRFEVVVVDNGSRDETAALLDAPREKGSHALLGIRRERGQGPAPARNEGWRTAGAPLIAFTDDDCLPAFDWLERGLAAAAAAPGQVIQGRTEPIPSELAQAGPYSRTQVVDRAGPHYQTCNIFYPRALLERLDGFDERFRQPAGEDTDLAWRAIEAGAAIEFAPDVLVQHAVEDLGPLGMLRVAGRWSDLMYVLGAHPGYRSQTRWRRIFWKQSHALLAQALLGLALSRRSRLAALLAAPYVLHLLRRARTGNGSAAHVPFFALHDLVEMYAVIRGAVRHRVLVL